MENRHLAQDHIWYSRPVFFVSNIQAAINFYVEKLGFEKKWHELDGKGNVCQVDRGGSEIILCEDKSNQNKGRLFLELSKQAVDQLLQEIAEHNIPTRKTHWGYEVLEIKDPDGNELLVCLENLL